MNGSYDMSHDKTMQIRNSTAEFLVFTSQAGEKGIEVRVADETVWLTQKLIAAQERKRREHQYKLAVEYRRGLEATAYRWYYYWGLRYPSNIYIIR